MTSLPTPADTAAVDAAITSRRSIRAFLPKPVSRVDIEHILQVAARAPSGTNTQPWRVHVLTGASRQRLVDRIVANGGRLHAAIKDIPEMKVRVAFAKDPEGNLAELVQML